MRVRSISHWGALWLIAGLVAVSGARAQEPESRPASQPGGPSPTTAPSTAPAPSTASAPSPISGPAGPRVALDIACEGQDWGRIVIELYPDKTPATAQNFLRYVDAGFYDGTIFHRVIPTYVIQGGGWTSPTELKKEGLQKPIPNEARNGLKNGLKNVRGAVAMARARNPVSATSQFYINLEDNPKLDYPDGDGSGYCVFGQVVEGLDVVGRIKGVPTRRNPLASNDNSDSLPVNPPIIKRAYRVGAAPAAAPAPARPQPPESQPQPPASQPGEYNQEGPPEPTPEVESPNKPVGAQTRQR